MKIEADGESWEEQALMLTLCNGPREGGGFIIAPEARNNDGRIEYALVRKCGRLMMFRLLPEFLKGTHMGFPQIRMGSCTSLSVRADRSLYIHADGEVFTSFGSYLTGVRFELLPGALQVIKGPAD
jgi:diacylglycerol kinase (ATP)